MALQVSNLKRDFVIEQNGKQVKLEDPNPNMSPEEVAKFYASKHPEITNATLSGPKVVGDKAEYSFKPTVGTKG